MFSYLAVVDDTICIECEACMEACMHGAITFVTPKKGISNE